MRKIVHSVAGTTCGLMLLLMVAMPAAAFELFDSSVQSQLTHSRMGLDLFHRLGAVGRDAKAEGIPIGKTFRQIWGSVDNPSIDAVAASLKDHAAIEKLLETHDLSAHDFVVGTLALTRSQYAAAGLVDKQKLNPQNLQFYDEHKKQADEALARLMNAGGAAVAGNPSDNSNSHDLTLEDLQKMDRQMLAECTKVGILVMQANVIFAAAYVGTHYPQMSGASISGDDMLTLSKNMEDLSANMPQRDLARYLSTMSEEIKRQAFSRPIEYSPAFEQALAGYTVWGESHCSKAALTK
jgi:hypothetical protein